MFRYSSVVSYEKRKQIVKFHEDYTKGFLYFIQHDTRVPEHLRNEMLNYGYPKDEYQDNNHWTHQIYIREARRMIGEYVMTENSVRGHENVINFINKINSHEK